MTEQTWRTLLGKIISDPKEKQRVAKAMGVNPLTLQRWSTKVSNPRPDKLLLLLDAFPQYREQLIILLQEEYPGFQAEGATVQEIPEQIPTPFYIRTLNAHATLPSQIRAATTRLAIVQQMLNHLDSQETGTIIFLAQCVPPRPNQHVRSLRITFGRGTPPWRDTIEHLPQFFGAESQVGYALLLNRYTVAQNRQESIRLFQTHPREQVESVMAVPLMLSGYHAGCLGILSVRPGYFTEARQRLIQQYTDLMTLAFDDSEFYTLDQIQLGIVPPYDVQQPILQSFPQHLLKQMSHSHLSRQQAETAAWQEIEEKLLQHAIDMLNENDEKDLQTSGDLFLT